MHSIEIRLHKHSQRRKCMCVASFFTGYEKKNKNNSIVPSLFDTDWCSTGEEDNPFLQIKRRMFAENVALPEVESTKFTKGPSTKR